MRSRFATEQVGQREAPIGAHRHDSPEVFGDIERPLVSHCDRRRHHQVHCQAVGSSFGLESDQPVEKQDKCQEAGGSVLAPSHANRL